MRILVAGQSGSIHATRFVSMLQDLGHEVRLFVCDEWYWQEEHLYGTTTYVAFPTAHNPPVNANTLIVTYPEERIVPAVRRAYDRMRAAAERDNAGRPRSAELVGVLERYRPDVVISCKMQNEGYTVAEAKERMGEAFPCPWIHFCWGTDIEFFGKHPDQAGEHRPRIEHALSRCDFLFADTRRDLREARSFGFRGESLGSFLAHGGFDLKRLEALRRKAPARRDVILVKGRQGGYVGHAMNVLKALEATPDRLRGYRVMVMMATPDVVAHAKGQGRAAGVDYEVLGRLPYADLLELYGRTRIAISATDVDGTPSFLVEAMAMGALPIHSDMESVREWVADGINSLLFPVADIEALRRQIERGLTDDALCRQAAIENWAITRSRMDRHAIAEQIDQCLRKVVRQEASQSASRTRRFRRRVLKDTTGFYRLLLTRLLGRIGLG